MKKLIIAFATAALALAPAFSQEESAKEKKKMTSTAK